MSEDGIKESTIKEILNFWPVKWIIILLLLTIVYSGGYHFYRCHLGLNSKFLWGASECLECKAVTIDSITKRDTIRIRDTVRFPSYVKSDGTGKAGGSKFDLDHPSFNAPTQLGDNNTQNNQIGPKQRIVSDQLIDNIIYKMNGKNIPINYSLQTWDDESKKVLEQIKSKLSKKGYHLQDAPDMMPMSQDTIDYGYIPFDPKTFIILIPAGKNLK